MADNEQQNIIETDPEKVVEEEKTSFLKQIKDTAKNSAKELKKMLKFIKIRQKKLLIMHKTMQLNIKKEYLNF